MERVSAGQRITTKLFSALMRFAISIFLLHCIIVLKRALILNVETSGKVYRNNIDES